MIYHCLLLAVVLTSISSQREKWLLPGTVIPHHYNITLFTYMENFDDALENSFTFDGMVSIDFMLAPFGSKRENLTEIVLHRDISINITSMNIISPEGNHTISQELFDAETNKQTLAAHPPLAHNTKYTINLEYTGLHCNESEGFFKRSYDSKGNKRWLLFTQFEPLGARKAFPCFDEPRYKATFSISVAFNSSFRSMGYHALSNAEILREENTDGWYITHFKTTPFPMSTYLVAFIVSDYRGSRDAWFGKVGNLSKPFKTWGPFSQIETGKDNVSQSFGPRLIDTFSDFLNQDFPFDKLDQASIPGEFPGGMENWGLITYRDDIIFPTNGSALENSNTAIIVAHELAHQWFGNLVTMHWWSDVWLNEGFATFFEYYVLEKLLGDEAILWNLPGKFSELILNAFAFDSIPTTPALTSNVWSPKDVNLKFGPISYNKGAAVLRMWQHCVGHEIFVESIRKYLKSSQFSIVYPEDLLLSFFKTIQNAPLDDRPVLPSSVLDIFKSWHIETGHPVLNVVRMSNNSLLLTQERFMLGPTKPPKRGSPWFIPLTYSSSQERDFENTTPIKYFVKGDHSANITMNGSDVSWFILNNQMTGFYRVNYEMENWKALHSVLDDVTEYTIIHELNRAQIINDVTFLALCTHTQYIPVSVALGFLSYLRHERSLAPWIAGSIAIDTYLFAFSDDLLILKNFKEFAMELVSQGYLNFMEDNEGTVADETLYDIFQVNLRRLNASEKSARLIDSHRKRWQRNTYGLLQKNQMQKMDRKWMARNRNELLTFLENSNSIIRKR